MLRSLIALLGCSLVVLLAGCGTQVHPVKGSVRFADGTPLTLGRVIVESDDSKTGSWGTILPDGTFEIGTFTPNDGVPAGTYRVYLSNTVTVPPSGFGGVFVPKPLVHSKYGNKDTAGLTFEVPKQTTWDITVEKPEK